MDNWTYEKAKEIFDLPILELIYRAQTVHRQNFDPQAVQVSSLLSIKTGGCSENCSYCSQSVHNKAKINKQAMMNVEEVVNAAKLAKQSGSTRFCMAASGRAPSDDELEHVCKIISEVKKLELETCVSLGLLNQDQAYKLKECGLDYYNHNLDTSREYYSKIISTRTFDDRIDTINCIRKAGIKLCCGGILGLGETNEDRIKLLVTLANFNPPPESIPINKLIKIPGTLCAIGTSSKTSNTSDFEDECGDDVSSLDFIRINALARIMMPKSYLRLSSGRAKMSREFQMLCFLTGSNSIFYGEKLLTADNAIPASDEKLFAELNLEHC